MRAFRMIGRSIRDAFKSVIRNFSLSLASITCITITLLIVAVTFVISYNANNFTEEAKKDVSVVVFVDTDANEQQIAFIRDQLLSMENVISDELVYRDKTEVKNEIKNSDEDLSKVIESWDEGDNPLRATFTLKVKDVEQIGKTAKEIETIDKVYTAQYGEGVVEKLLDAFDVVKKCTIIISLALVIVTIFLIINTIKLTIYSRKSEISIMRLVGASNARIKLPFVVEGIILGIIGSIIPITFIIFGYRAIYNKLGGIVYSQLVKLIEPFPFVLVASAFIIILGMVVGMIGSASAVRKYIRV